MFRCVWDRAESIEEAAPVALWSGWLWALYPAALQYAVHWIWEMSLSTCMFTWAIVLALRLRGRGKEERDGTGQLGGGRRSVRCGG